MINSIPWHTPDLWRAVNEAIARPLATKPGSLASVVATARRMDRSIAFLDDHMTTLCTATCSTCRDICCQRAKVWYDFKDLLFIHFSGRPYPPGQALSHIGDQCRYLGPSGCMLPRTRRPFICLWYLCPRQKSSLSQGVRNALDAHLEMIKKDRRLLEDQFVAGIF